MSTAFLQQVYQPLITQPDQQLPTTGAHLHMRPTCESQFPYVLTPTSPKRHNNSSPFTLWVTLQTTGG